MSIQTADPNVEPPNDVDTEMAVSKFKNKNNKNKLDMIKSRLN
jgi:hypothetical protein